ncbi:glycosyltransferase family 1 protein [Botryobasidium botryosum FD-172 SS1]|uniref:UDP-N-acetylglucosamine transferase subunit ALG14 n=1 Tax=Botryobasidium botryosum (strain FD-172 SS1) TaxID=930990 RepID=A0A067MSD2_BOTB1|nr:glycosyltransferase family 1 protein [Botryobasidium botryosum FD-172 SS1]
MDITTLLIFALLLLLCAGARIYAILPGRRRVLRRPAPSTCSLAVFLGSGGHTSEALLLLSSLNFDRYSRRKYIIGEGDTLSAQKALQLEESKANSGSGYTIYNFPRARRVHQSLLSTPPTFLRSLLHAILVICVLPAFKGKPFADVLILNGPGTCVPICAAAYMSRFLGLPSSRIVYVESFARVKSLSLSGKILRPFVDRFVVQWPGLLSDGARGDCRGWLV